MAGPGPLHPNFAVSVASAEPARGTVVEVRGELDSASCEELMGAVQAAVAVGPSELTLDLSQVTFVDSAGMRTLIMIERLAAEQGVTLTLTPAPEHVTELLRTAGVVDRGTPDTQEASPAAHKFIERTELELPRDPHSPARARGEVRGCVSGKGKPEVVATVVLLTSELVTNAVVHPRGVGGTPIGMRVILYEDGVRVEVEDSGRGFDQAKTMPSEGEGGRGLFLVDRFSDRWGSQLVDTTAGPRFRVWFELGWEEQGNQAVA